MAFNMTILSIDEEGSRGRVLFEDTSSGVTKKMSFYIPEEVGPDEAAVLDYVASLWPYEEFTQRGKAPADRQKEMKKIVGQTKNITGRVSAGQP